MGIFEIAGLIWLFDSIFFVAFFISWIYAYNAASSKEERDNADKWKKYLKPLLIIGAVCIVVMIASAILEEVNGPARCPICHERDCPGATAHAAEIWEYSEK